MRIERQHTVFVQDLRYAVRHFAHNRGFALTAILIIALGIGATTTILSVVDPVLLRPLPYPASDRLVLIWDNLTKLGVRNMPVSSEDFNAFRANSNVFQAAAAFRQEDRSLITQGNAERILTISSTPGLLQMLGAESAIGRSFVETDWQSDHSHVAIISNSLFRLHFAANQNVIGQTMRLDDQIYTIIGVLPRGFEFSIGSGIVDVWTPLSGVTEHRKAQFAMLAKLNPDIDIRAAQASITATAKHLELLDHPYQGPNGEAPGYSATVISLHDQLFGNLRKGALILINAVMLLLLIACVNITNLLIARAATREKETTMRRVLGASRLRLFCQWTTEIGLLVMFGGVVGVVVSYCGIAALKALMPADMPGIAHIGMNARVLLFIFLVSALVCFLMAVAPLFSMTIGEKSLRVRVQFSKIANLLVIVEVAMTFVLLISAGLLLKSFAYLRHIDPGFHPDHLLTMEINLSGPRYEKSGNRVQFFSQLQHKLDQLPGVISASAVDRLPVFTVGVDTRSGNPFSVDGHPFDPRSTPQQIAHTQTVEPDYFHALGGSLLDGRTFSESDTADTPPVAVINRTLARGVFPHGDALGRRILLGAPSPGARWMTIIGIVGDLRTGALDLPPMPQFYTPMAQDAPSHLYVLVRTVLDPKQMEHTAAGVVHQLDPEQPIEKIATMEDHLNDTMGQPRFQGVLLTSFAIATLFLTSIGIYGVVTHTTIQRTKEIGIRMALGATRNNVLKVILFDGLKPVFLGLVSGVILIAVVARLLQSSLYGVRPEDPLIIIAGTLLLASLAIAACVSPAWRATRVDPMVTLRYE